MTEVGNVPEWGNTLSAEHSQRAQFAERSDRRKLAVELWAHGIVKDPRLLLQAIGEDPDQWLGALES